MSAIPTCHALSLRGQHRPSRRSQSGLSLIELMVALTIGLAVVGVAATAYLNTSSNTRSANVLAQMNEDANAALSIIRSQVLLAGYSSPVGVSTQTITVNNVPKQVSIMTRAYVPDSAQGGANNFIVGCDGGFTNNRAHELFVSQLACTSPPAGSSTHPGADAIAVVYEADASTTYPTSAGLPTDCLGNAIPARTIGTSTNIYIASNKFFLSTGPGGNTELYCQGNGRSSITTTDDSLPSTGTTAVTPQPLVENINDLQITYGIASTTTTGAGTTATTTVNKEAVAYLSATDLNKLTDADKWSRVVSARVCVEVQSATTVPSGDQAKYLNCRGEVADVPAGNHLVRTYTTTVVLHNRI